MKTFLALYYSKERKKLKKSLKKKKIIKTESLKNPDEEMIYQQKKAMIIILCKNIFELNNFTFNEKVKQYVINIYSKTKLIAPNVKTKGLLALLSELGNLAEILEEIDNFGKKNISKPTSMTFIDDASIEESMEDESSLKSRSKSKNQKTGRL